MESRSADWLANHLETPAEVHFSSFNTHCSKYCNYDEENLPTVAERECVICSDRLFEHGLYARSVSNGE